MEVAEQFPKKAFRSADVTGLHRPDQDYPSTAFDAVIERKGMFRSSTRTGWRQSRKGKPSGFDGPSMRKRRIRRGEFNQRTSISSPSRKEILKQLLSQSNNRFAMWNQSSIRGPIFDGSPEDGDRFLAKAHWHTLDSPARLGRNRFWHSRIEFVERRDRYVETSRAARLERHDSKSLQGRSADNAMSLETITKVLYRTAKAPRIDDQILVANIRWAFMAEFRRPIFHRSTAWRWRLRPDFAGATAAPLAGRHRIRRCLQSCLRPGRRGPAMIAP
jgi:hypothetical protein